MPTLARLEEELRFAPREVILRVVDRLETLGTDISPGGVYPDDWIVHRVTGYRPDKTSNELTPGAALLAGLSPMSERLCEHVALQQREVPDSLTSAALLARWHISPQTLTRLRKQGLVARRVLGESGRAQLAFRPAATDAFEAAHGESLSKAAAFSKLSPRDRRWALRAAPRYRAWAGLSSQAAAARIGARLGRATETIRTLLAREGLSSTRTTRKVSQPALWRASRWGALPKTLARELHRSPSVVRRDIAVVRLTHLRSIVAHLETPATRLSTPALDDHVVLTGLGQAPPATLPQFIALARLAKPPVALEERARLAAFHTLRARSLHAILALNTLQPRPGALDQIETDLRWAARLGVVLLQSQLRTIVSSLEGRLERPLDTLPPAFVIPVILESLRASANALEAIDPAKGARVAAAVGLAVDRVGARLPKLAPAARSAAPHSPPMPDWSLALHPWQRFIEPDPRLRIALAADHLAQGDGLMLAARFGLSGPPPRTLAGLAKELTTTERQLASDLHRAFLAALAPYRGPAYPAHPAGRTLNP
ncbi:MAG: hypothetical protein WC718_15760 [Phycisphaerales bacterium]